MGTKFDRYRVRYMAADQELTAYVLAVDPEAARALFLRDHPEVPARAILAVEDADAPARVKIVDIEVPFASLVILLIKVWAASLIPAVLFFWLLLLVFSSYK